MAGILARFRSDDGAWVAGFGAFFLWNFIRPVRDFLFSFFTWYDHAACSNLHLDPEGVYAGDQRHIWDSHSRVDGITSSRGALLSLRRSVRNEHHRDKRSKQKVWISHCPRQGIAVFS